jgi:hypothetical protein
VLCPIEIRIGVENRVGWETFLVRKGRLAHSEPG